MDHFFLGTQLLLEPSSNLQSCDQCNYANLHSCHHFAFFKLDFVVFLWNFVDYQIYVFMQARVWTCPRTVVSFGNFISQNKFDYYRWCDIKALPGANRLIRHFWSKGLSVGLASNSPRSNIEAKISYHHGIVIYANIF